MSESETPEVTDQEIKPENTHRKRIRHRKKQLYENILKQMEFYFSDANLTKDRFLGELVKNDPYVPLDIFLKFNKIRSMTQDVTDITKAMKNSTLLDLSEDKLKVRRKCPVLPYDADTRTVYVESIPVTASRDWLQRVFSDYGHVTYISLPKFKNSHKIKGFGFIEFEKPEDAQRCIHTFTKMGCKLPTFTPPEELSSIKMFSVEEPLYETAESKDKEEHEPPKKKKKNKEKKPKNLGLKLETDADLEKGDTPTPSEENKTITTPSEELNTPDIECKIDTSHETIKGEESPRKKTRKRSTKDRSKNGLGPNEAPKSALWGLQVLAKAEWKSLRNKYLNLQRKYMKEMKANMQINRYAYTGIPAPSAEEEPATNPEEAQSAKNDAPLERISGVFVKEVLPEPCLDVRLTKRTIRSNVHVLHVDVKESQSDVIIRFDSSKAAEEYCANASHAHVLTGEDEDTQWTRAEAARAAKRPRGREKLLARNAAAAAAPDHPQPTHTHIRFDDE